MLQELIARFKIRNDGEAGIAALYEKPARKLLAGAEGFDFAAANPSLGKY
jgi:hypothetical protein